MKDYANAILSISKVSKFEQGKLSLVGKLEFSNKGQDWCKGKLSTTGYKGKFRFKDIFGGFEVIDWNTNQ